MIGKVAKTGVSLMRPMGASVRRVGLYPGYHKHLIGGPRAHIPFAEKAFWGLFFCVGVLATPAWILVNLEHYKGKK